MDYGISDGGFDLWFLSKFYDNLLDMMISTTVLGGSGHFLAAVVFFR